MITTFLFGGEGGGGFHLWNTLDRSLQGQLSSVMHDLSNLDNLNGIIQFWAKLQTSEQYKVFSVNDDNIFPLVCELNIIVFSLENFLLFQIVDITKNVTHDAPLQ